MRPELLEGLTPEQIAKVKSCNDPKELLKLIEEEDVCLNEAQLAAVSGGGCGGGGSIECPDCGSDEFKELSPKSVNGIVTYYYRCKKCGKVWYEI